MQDQIAMGIFTHFCVQIQMATKGADLIGEILPEFQIPLIFEFRIETLSICIDEKTITAKFK